MGVKMNPEIKRWWIERLRSGKDRQGQDALRTQHGPMDTPAFCCLGLLCDIAVQKGLDLEITDFEPYTEYDHTYEALPVAVQEWAGIDSENPIVFFDDEWTSLAELNDSGHTFAEIADIIEGQL